METNHGILYINFNRDKLLIIPFYQILLFFSSEETVDRKQGSVKSDRSRKVSSCLGNRVTRVARIARFFV